MSLAAVTREDLQKGPHGIWRYHRFLPVPPDCAPVSLGEGETPLVRSAHLGPDLGLRNLYFKLEGSNPTGSYKDRIASVALTRCRAQRKPAVIGTSSGNTGAATAAYCSRAGVPYLLLTLENVSEPKLIQSLMYGARAIAVKGFGTDPQVSQAVFDMVQAVSRERGWELMITANACNPEAMQGVKTIAYEICQQLDWRAPGQVFVPVGAGGLLASCWQGFRECRNLGLVDGTPAMVSVQPEGCAHVARAFAAGRRQTDPFACTSLISGLQVPNALDGDLALDALYRSGGTALTVADADIYEAQRRLALQEGIFCEPAGAAATAGLIRAAAEGRVHPDETVVCLVTGIGFKDLDSVYAAVDTGLVPKLTLADVREKLKDLV